MTIAKLQPRLALIVVTLVVGAHTLAQPPEVETLSVEGLLEYYYTFQAFDLQPPSAEEIRRSEEIVTRVNLELERRNITGTDLATIITDSRSQNVITGLFKYANTKPDFAESLLPAARERAETELNEMNTGRLVQCVRYIAEHGNSDDLDFIQSLPESQILITSTVRQAVRQMKQRLDGAESEAIEAEPPKESRSSNANDLPSGSVIGQPDGAVNPKIPNLLWASALIIILATGVAFVMLRTNRPPENK